MGTIDEELKAHIEGEVYFDAVTRSVYSVDASIFEIEPLGVIIPKTKEDLIRAVEIAYAYRLPITMRGAATGITGGCLGKGLIIDTSKYLHHILEINPQQGYVICEPGVVQDQLNQQLAIDGYRLGPDTSTGNRATLGGMLANNAAGARSLRYGKMVDHIQSVELVLAQGELIRFQSISQEEWQQKQQAKTTEGRIYHTIWQIKENYRDEIEQRFPKIPRRVSGYNLDELIKDQPLNVSKLIAGSEGTLGIITEMKLAIVPQTKLTGLCLIYFDDILIGMRHIPELLSYHPLALEMIDDQIIELGRASPSLRGQLDWLSGQPKALFITELEGQTPNEVQAKITDLTRNLQKKNIGYAYTSLLDPKQMAKVWKLRKAGLGILLSKRTYSRAIAFLEDITLSPDRLPSFMEKFCAYLRSKGKWAGIYGHAGSGCMHIRPYMNLQSPEEYALMYQMMLDVSDLLLEYGGALSGEHGDGLIRSWLNPKMFGTKLTKAFIELKTAFDPDNLMNPGKIVLASPPFEELRSNPREKLREPPTFLNFISEGGFALAADLCNGNGLCRKKEGIMCPSFQATQDEFHSTRARAQALRTIIHGRLPMEDFTSQGMYDVMDLCITCKGCRTECPSEVDMAKMKAEFLYHYQEKHGYPLRSHLFGQIGLISHWVSPFAKFFNWLNQTAISKGLLSKAGITSKRTLPPLATQRFSKWFKNYRQLTQSAKKVVLFNDTFNEFYEPEIGKAAVRILNELGHEVIVPPWSCCGRPAISKGLLRQAQSQVGQLIRILRPFISSHIPIIGLEPSCLLTIRDDHQSFMISENEFTPDIQAISSQCLTLDEFFAHQIDSQSFILPFKGEKKEVKVHGHCHQKALVGMEPTLKVLNTIPGFKVSEIPSGCCGMAGSFGYEKEHYHISMQIGELSLFPAIRASHAGTLFIANGTSCRHQIANGVQRQAVHLAEAINSQF